MRTYRLLIVVLALAAILAGCFSSSHVASPVADRVDLFLDVEDGEGGVRPVTLTAVPRSGSPALSPEDLQIEGMTPGGEIIPLDWDILGGPPQGDEGQGSSPGELTIRFSLDIPSLLGRGITKLRIYFGTNPKDVLEVNLEELWDPDSNGDEPGDDDNPPVDPGRPSDEPEIPSDEPGTPQDPGTNDPPVSGPRQTVEIRTIRPGTSVATPAYIIRSVNPGPTVVVVGGVHGSETSGWMAAWEISKWEIDAGTLVVIPEANKRAVEARRRTGPDGADLNRLFPVGKQPTTPFARELWDFIVEMRPVALIDLHEGWGLRRLGHRFSDGTLSVGQTLIRYNVKDADQFARHVTSYLDRYHVNNLSLYSWMVIGPPVAGSLARKAGAELGIPAFITEPSQYQTLLSTRIRWQKVFVEELLKWYGLLRPERVIVPKQYRAQGAGAGGFTGLMAA